MKGAQPCNARTEWKPSPRAARTRPPTVPVLGKRRRSPPRREKPYRRPFYPQSTQPFASPAKKDFIWGFFFSCLVIEFFLKATYSQPGVVWPHDFGQQPARRLRSRDRSHPGALGRGPRSLRSQPPPLTTAQPFAPQMGKPETETFFPAPPSSAIRACSERGGVLGGRAAAVQGNASAPHAGAKSGVAAVPKKDFTA